MKSTWPLRKSLAEVVIMVTNQKKKQTDNNMKRTTKFLIGAATVALTFGSLVAIEGPKDWNAYHHAHRWHHHHDCSQYDHDDRSRSSEREEDR